MREMRWTFILDKKTRRRHSHHLQFPCSFIHLFFFFFCHSIWEQSAVACEMSLDLLSVPSEIVYCISCTFTGLCRFPYFSRFLFFFPPFPFFFFFFALPVLFWFRCRIKDRGVYGVRSTAYK